jgi:hypothetical protein
MTIELELHHLNASEHSYFWGGGIGCRPSRLAGSDRHAQPPPRPDDGNDHAAPEAPETGGSSSCRSGRNRSASALPISSNTIDPRNGKFQLPVRSIV